MNTTTFLYSKATSVFYTIFFLLLSCIAPLLISSNYGKDHDLIFPSICALALFARAIWIIIKIMIPAFKNQVILELNEEFFCHNLKPLKVSWADVESVKTMSNRLGSFLLLKLKSSPNKTHYLNMRWISGSNTKIYDTVMSYFTNSSKISE